LLTLEAPAPAPRPRRREPRPPAWSRAVDPLALVAVGVLVGLGELNLLAIGDVSLAVHQLAAVMAGTALLLVLRYVRSSRLSLLGPAAYALAVALLLVVLARGRGAYGAQRWLSLGSFDIQPSELAKLGVLLLLALLLSGRRPGWRRAAGAMAAAAVPIALTLRQPDLSTATLLTLLAFVLLLLARAPLALLAGVLATGAAAAPLLVHFLRPYQLARLNAFLSGASSSGGPGWAILQAHIAVGRGGLLGSAQDPLHGLLALYLPARESDLAFASLVEQWGLAAGIAAVAAVIVLVWRLALASRRARTRQSGLVAAGLALLIGCETVVSVGGNLGALPLAGVPFPFLSYGGTVAAVHLAALGIALAGPREARRRELWMPPRWLRLQPRLVRLASIGFALQLAALSVFAYHLQAASGPQLREAGEVQMSRCAVLPAPRGMLTDRHGAPLATAAAVDDVLVPPGLLQGRPAAQRQLAALMGIAPASLQRLLDQPADGPVVNLGEVPADVGARIQFSQIPGLAVVQAPHRTYPYGSLLGPLLGYTGLASPGDLRGRPDLGLNSYDGRTGLERQYDAVLRGVDGTQCFYVDPAGRTAALGPYTPPVPGSDVRLTLDLGLQQDATGALAGALRGVAGQPRGDQGAVVVMDARTGAVLAMASLPSVDNSVFGPPGDPAAIQRAGEGAGDPMLEHATQDAMPPGSTFKLVVGAADTVFGAIPIGQVIPTGYTFSLGDHTFHGWTSLPPQNLTQAIGWSNDVYFYKLALALGPDRIHDVGSQLGVGTATGIDLPGESPGYLGTPGIVEQLGGTWYPGTSVILGIGQGEVTATPLQDARWTAAVTTGRLVTPRLGLAFGAGGQATALPAPAPAALPFAGALGPVRDGMRLAVTGGTATLLRDVPAPAGAKTGTAEDPSTPSGGEDAWFTAVAPIDNPEVVVTVLVRGGGEGAITSGPVADQVLRYYFAHRDAILRTAPFAPLPG
jgi:cell division protein FtsI/penicillin-binding protein 2/cell division protein FtsW (lipid II flippase)